MNAVARSLGVGSVLEVLALCCSIPKDSTRPETGLQLVMAYTQVPGIVAFRVLSGLVASLPAVIGIPVGILGLGVVFVIQAGLFALPFWFIARWWNLRLVRS